MLCKSGYIQVGAVTFAYRMPGDVHAMLTNTHRKKMLHLARTLASKDALQARGRCFALALSYAAFVRELGIEVELLRWTVRDDPEFCEHWAIKFGRHQALDLTRIQVDGKVDPAIRIQDYPSNFVALRSYPSQILINSVTVRQLRNGERLPAKFMLRSHWALTRHDMLEAMREKQYTKATARIANFAVFGLRFAVSRYLAQSLRRKHELLLRR